MARLKIVWTITTISQRNGIFEYWNNRNKSTVFARKLNSKIKERLLLVQTNPLLGKDTSFNGTRAISMGNYSIMYQAMNLKLLLPHFGTTGRI